MPTPHTLFFLFAPLLGSLSLALIVIVYLKERDRRNIIRRHDAPKAALLANTAEMAPLLRTPTTSLSWAKWIPSKWTTDPVAATQLVHSGFESPLAPIYYALARLLSLVTFPTVMALAAFGFHLKMPFLYLAWGILVGWIAPERYLLKKSKERQLLLRRALPDALDLMVVCIEAGNGLDAAMLRVARELARPHPALSKELLLVNRRIAAGLPREEALRELWTRTQIDEVRALVSNLVQSERLGTSSGKVLRVYAESLRRKRRQTAEQKAATAAIKMLIPMTVLILPALFIVILGPAGMNITTYFSHP